MNTPAIFGKAFSDDAIPVVQELFDSLSKNCDVVYLYENFRPYVEKRIALPQNVNYFSNHQELASSGADLMISLGGDGTILDAVTFIRDSGIPIMGINLGRLGFLSNVPRNLVGEALQQIFSSEYEIQSRTLITVETEGNLFEDLWEICSEN